MIEKQEVLRLKTHQYLQETVVSVWYWERGCGLSHINNKYLSLLIVRHYRHTSFYCTSLYRASQVLCFLQVKDLWQPCVKEVYKLHFSNSICSLCVPVSHFGNSYTIPNFFIIIIFVMAIYDQ